MHYKCVNRISWWVILSIHILIPRTVMNKSWKYNFFFYIYTQTFRLIQTIYRCCNVISVSTHKHFDIFTIYIYVYIYIYIYIYIYVCVCVCVCVCSVMWFPAFNPTYRPVFNYSQNISVLSSCDFHVSTLNVENSSKHRYIIKTRTHRRCKPDLQQYDCVYIYIYIHIYAKLRNIIWYKSAMLYMMMDTLRWRHNGRDSVSNHQPHDCLLNRLFRRRWKKTSKLCVTGLCAGNSTGTGEFPHKWPVTRTMFPFDDVIMNIRATNTSAWQTMICSLTIEAAWHIYVSGNWAIIDSDCALSPLRCQAIIWINANLLFTGPLWANFSQVWIKIQQFSYKNMTYVITYSLPSPWPPPPSPRNLFEAKLMPQTDIAMTLSISIKRLFFLYLMLNCNYGCINDDQNNMVSKSAIHKGHFVAYSIKSDGFNQMTNKCLKYVRSE